MTAGGEGDAPGEVIEPARGRELAKLLLLGLVLCAGFPLIPFVLIPDEADSYVGTYWLIVAIGTATVVIAGLSGYVLHGSHRVVVTADEVVYSRGGTSERYRRSEIASVRVVTYLRHEVISVCTPEKSLFMVKHGWWGRESAERLAELLGVPLLTE